MNLWIDATVMSSLYVVGNILFGHFEERSPKWRRILKFFMFTGLIVLISAYAGRAWSIGFVGVLLCLVLGVHLVWLPKHGINPFTGEPKDKYYALRGWKV